MNKASEMQHRTYRTDSATCELPRHTEMALTEKEQMVPKPEDEVAQRRNMCQKKLKNHKLWPRSKFKVK